MLIFTSITAIIDLPPISFDINVANEGNTNYFFSILTNSVHRCSLSINLSNSDGLLHSITSPNFYTGSVDCSYARQIYDIPTTFNLTSDHYTLGITTTQPVYIYEIHIKPHISGHINEIDYKPLITNDTTTYDSSFNNFVIIPNMSASFGGLWYCVYQALVGIHLADKNNLIPIVDFNGGLYGSNSIYDSSNLPNSWWNYFYEDPFPFHPDEKNRILEYSRTHLQSIRLHSRLHTILPISPTNCYLYTRQTYSQTPRYYKNIDFRELLQKYMRPLPYVKEYCSNFWQTYNPDNKLVVGVHYRGTDKYSTHTATESFPIHYSYNIVANIIRDKLLDLKIETFVLYCASDEEPFIEYMKTQFDNVVCNTHSTRSSVSTSGIKFDFDNIRYGKTTDLVQRTNYDYVKSISLHFGNKDISNFVKGFYAITDCALFKPCNVLFISQGNFSDFATYHTEHETKVFKLNELYKPYVNELIVK